MANKSSGNKIVKIVAALAVGTLALVFLSPVIFPISQPDFSAPARTPMMRAKTAPSLSVTPTVVPTPMASATAAKSNADHEAAMDLVGTAIEGNTMEVTSADLLAKTNPRGAGTFVYVQKTRFAGTERNLIWMVIDGKAFALNSPSKMVTPSLPWPREAQDAAWEKTKIDKFSGASEAIEIVY